jgi:hypothetical protein
MEGDEKRMEKLTEISAYAHARSSKNTDAGNARVQVRKPSDRGLLDFLDQREVAVNLAEIADRLVPERLPVGRDGSQDQQHDTPRNPMHVHDATPCQIDWIFKLPEKNRQIN